MQTLQVLIDQLEKGRKLHISISDFSGILNTPLTTIRFENIIHSKEFCNVAKSTARGYKACLRCKMLANTKAIRQKLSFCGQCIYGMYEAAAPVVIDEAVMATVYVGNAIVNEHRVKERIQSACRVTGVSADALYEQLDRCESLAKPDELLAVAEIVADYLKMLHAASPSPKSEKHWLVTLMKQYAEENMEYSISLKEFAIVHQKNVQYIGRLFKSSVGISFNQYCNGVRLRKAAVLLAQGDEKIIDIAFSCGFNNVSYFNRVFQRTFGITPTEYRNQNRIK